MRRLIVMVMAGAMLLAPMSGCKKKKRVAGAAQETPSEPATMLATSDPRAALQLTKGFHEVENGWRWSEKNFAASLKAPVGATEKGATLVLKFSVMDVSLAKLGPMTLTGKVGATQCPAQKYEKAGQYEYKCDIPGSSMGGALVPVEFSLDKALPVTENDQRELGLVVAMVGFEAK